MVWGNPRSAPCWNYYANPTWCDVIISWWGSRHHRSHEADLKGVIVRVLSILQVSLCGCLPFTQKIVGWNVNGRLIWSSRTENFQRKRVFLKGSPKLPNTKWALNCFLPLFPDLLVFIRTWRNVRGSGTWTSHGNFDWGLDASHLSQLRTNLFLRLNLKNHYF